MDTTVKESPADNLTPEEYIGILEKKMSQYEKAIETLGVNAVGITTAGPKEVEDPKTGTKEYYYRVSTGNGEIVARTSPAVEEEIKVGSEVVVIANLITQVICDSLKKVEPDQSYKLIDWNEIIGLDEQIEEIRSSVQMTLQSDSSMKEFGLEPIKGILLYGPPGCGKTMIAKAIAKQIINRDRAQKGEFIYVKGSEILNSYVGATEQAIAQMFATGREYTEKTGNKAVIFIDEADAILHQRGTHAGLSIAHTIVPVFLSEMDGLNDNNPFVLLSTNLPDTLDKAVIRPGRIDQIIKISRPGKKETISLSTHYLNKVSCADKKDEIAGLITESIFNSPLKTKVSGAMVSNIINLSAKNAYFRSCKGNTPKGIVLQDVVNCIAKMTQ